MVDFWRSRTHSGGTRPLPWVKTGQVVCPHIRFTLSPGNLNHLDPSKLTKLLFEHFWAILGHFGPFLGHFWAIWDQFWGCLKFTNWSPQIKLDVPWWEMYHNCNIGIESSVPVHSAVVLQWSFFAPKIITKIGGCRAKICNGYDPGVVVSA